MTQRRPNWYLILLNHNNLQTTARNRRAVLKRRLQQGIGQCELSRASAIEILKIQIGQRRHLSSAARRRHSHAAFRCDDFGGVQRAFGVKARTGCLGFYQQRSLRRYCSASLRRMASTFGTAQSLTPWSNEIPVRSSSGRSSTSLCWWEAFAW